MKPINFLILVLLLIALIPENSYSMSSNHLPGPLILSNINEKIQYIPNLEVFEDKSGKLTFNQIKNKLSAFKPNDQETINLGLTNSAIWCAFKIKNNTSEKWYIDIGEAYIDEIDVYIVNPDGSFNHISTGLFRGFHNHPVKSNHYIVPLNVAQNEVKTIFIRAKCSTFLKLPLILGTLQTHYEANHKKDFIFGIYFGLILALSIYNFFVFVSLRDITYLYYVFYINFSGATASWIRGYSPEFLEFVSPKLNHGNIYASLAFMFLILFTNTFLNIKQYNPKLLRIGNLFLIINSFSLLANLLGYFRIGFYFILAWIVVAIPYVMLYGIYSYRKGLRPALFYMIGFGIFTLGDFIFILNENGILAQSNLTHYSIQIGSSLEALILSFALAYKLNSFKKEKEIAQNQALAQVNQFAKELIGTQETERKRIAHELHDSVGQSLSLIKNRIAMHMQGIAKGQSFNELNDMVTGTIQEVRNISYGLRPFQLDILGLTQSIRSLVDEMADSSNISLSGTIENIDGILSKDAEINIFRIVQEALNNISKHSKASNATVDIMRKNEHIEITIEDNGIGINGSNNRSGLGLRGIHERVNILNGKLSISDNLPQGTSIKIQIGLHSMVNKPNPMHSQISQP